MSESKHPRTPDETIGPGSVSFSEYVSILQKHRRNGEKPTIESIREALGRRQPPDLAPDPPTVQDGPIADGPLIPAEPLIPEPASTAEPNQVNAPANIDSRSGMVLRELVELREQLARFEHEKTSLLAELRDAHSACAAYKAETLRLHQDLDELSRQAAQVQQDDAELAGAREKIDQLEALISTIRHEADDAVEQTRAWHEYATGLEQSIAELRGEVAELTSRLDTAVHRAKEAEAESNHLRHQRDEMETLRIEDQNRFAQEQAAALETLRARADEYEARLAANEGKLDEERARAARAEDEADEMTELAAAALTIESELRDAREETDALAAQLFLVRRELSAAQEVEAKRREEEQARLEEEARLAEEARLEEERIAREERVVRLSISGRENLLESDEPVTWYQKLRARPGLLMLFGAIGLAAYAIGWQALSKPTLDGMVTAPTLPLVAPTPGVITTAEASNGMAVVAGQPLFVIDPQGHPSARVSGEPMVLAAPGNGLLRDVEVAGGSVVEEGDFLCEVIDYSQTRLEVSVPSGSRNPAVAEAPVAIEIDGFAEPLNGIIREVRIDPDRPFGLAVIEFDPPVPRPDLGTRIQLGTLARVIFE